MKLSRHILVLASAIGLIGGSIAYAQSGAIGIAAAVVKEVKLSNGQTPKPKQIVLRQRIALGDLIQTGKASQVQLLLLDRSTLSIGANASVRIDRFVYDPAKGRGSSASVTRGAFRFMSGEKNQANKASISSPVATIGIRGTILEGVVGEGARDIAKGEVKGVKDAKADKQTATLVVLRGPGNRTQPGADVGAASVTSGGVTVELTGPMQAAYIPRAGAPPIAFRLSPAGLSKLNDQVFPQQAAGGSAAGSILGGVLKVLPGIIGGGGDSKPSGTQSPNDVPGRPPTKPN